jgi:hypothetical protein
LNHSPTSLKPLLKSAQARPVVLAHENPALNPRRLSEREHLHTVIAFGDDCAFHPTEHTRDFRAELMDIVLAARLTRTIQGQHTRHSLLRSPRSIRSDLSASEWHKRRKTDNAVPFAASVPAGRQSRFVEQVRLGGKTRNCGDGSANYEYNDAHRFSAWSIRQGGLHQSARRCATIYKSYVQNLSDIYSRVMATTANMNILHPPEGFATAKPDDGCTHI